ncbi:MAG TPA: ester cyclase [Rubrobacter sp.]|nr:ester cyclase [Rubrobacter sp.]
MSAQRNKALVRRFLQAHAKGDLDTMEEMLSPDFVDHNLIPGQRPGREGYLRSFAEFHAAYSHARCDIEKQLAEGDEVVTTFAVSATHDRGEWMGLVPTSKEFEAPPVPVCPLPITYTSLSETRHLHAIGNKSVAEVEVLYLDPMLTGRHASRDVLMLTNGCKGRIVLDPAQHVPTLVVSIRGSARTSSAQHE